MHIVDYFTHIYLSKLQHYYVTTMQTLVTGAHHADTMSQLLKCHLQRMFNAVAICH